MANRSYLLFLDEDDIRDAFSASMELGCKSSIPPLWLASFSAADIRIYTHAQLVDEGVFDDEDEEQDFPGQRAKRQGHPGHASLVSPRAPAHSRLIARRPLIVRRFGDAAASELDEFAAGVQRCPHAFVALSMSEVQCLMDPAEFNALLRKGLEELDRGDAIAFATFEPFLADGYLGYKAEFDRDSAFPWLLPPPPPRNEPPLPPPWKPSAHGGSDSLLAKKLIEVGLPLPTAGVLARGGVHTVGDLVARRASELLAFKRFRPKDLFEVREVLAKLGGWLIEEEPPPRSDPPAYPF